MSSVSGTTMGTKMTLEDYTFKLLETFHKLGVCEFEYAVFWDPTFNGGSGGEYVVAYINGIEVYVK